jgi:hypothetical protein
MPDLLAGTRDPVVKGQVVYSSIDPTLYGPGFSGDVALAATLPVFLLAGTVAAYGVAFLSVNAHPVRSHGSHVRVGVEVEPGGRTPGKPFVALDVHLETSAAGAPRIASQAGIWLPSPSDRPLRLALELATGPVAMGQLHGIPSTQLGLGLYWNP